MPNSIRRAYKLLYDILFRETYVTELLARISTVVWAARIRADGFVLGSHMGHFTTHGHKNWGGTPSDV
jgi:hypothetical protein